MKTWTKVVKKGMEKREQIKSARIDGEGGYRRPPNSSVIGGMIVVPPTEVETLISHFPPWHNDMDSFLEIETKILECLIFIRHFRVYQGLHWFQVRAITF